jgi:NodT family efflux transporter outer membrane factor (OMF) lipoprotein
MKKFERYFLVLFGIAAWIVILTAGCSARKDEPLPCRVPVPERFSDSGHAVYSRWWESFQDLQLNRVVERILTDNPDLRAAWARLDQARAEAEQTGAFLKPQAAANAAAFNASESKTGLRQSDRYAASIGVSYEVDVWGRLRALERAANFEAEAVQSDMESLAMSLAAEAAETWFAIVEHQARIELIQEQIETNETYLNMIRLRFGYGMAPALDVYQQSSLVAANRAEFPPLKSRLQVLNHKLSVLLGRPPGEDAGEIHSFLPDLPDLPAVGLPSELLKQRPDIRAASRRLAAADQRAAAAIANNFPSLRLTASTGYMAAELSDLFSNLIWNILGQVSQTVMDGGQKSAEIKQNQAIVEERAALYVKTAIHAFREVEDALIQESYQREVIEKMNLQIANARVTFDQSFFRYRNGLNDYLPVLTSLETLQVLEQQLLSAKRQLISYRIQLHRALGGTWIERLRIPD